MNLLSVQARSRRWFEHVALLLAALLALWRAASAHPYTVATNYADFGIFYRSAECSLATCDRYGPGDPNNTPPFVQWLFLPFTVFPIAQAFQAWTVLTLLCLAAAWEFTSRTLSRRYPGAIIAIIAAAASVQYLVLAGQVSAVVLLGLVWAWAVDRERGQLSLWVVPLVLWKPMLGLLGWTQSIPSKRHLDGNLGDCDCRSRFDPGGDGTVCGVVARSSTSHTSRLSNRCLDLAVRMAQL